MNRNIMADTLFLAGTKVSMGVYLLVHIGSSPNVQAAPNPSIERTPSSVLCTPPVAAHVQR